MMINYGPQEGYQNAGGIRMGEPFLGTVMGGTEFFDH